MKTRLMFGLDVDNNFFLDCWSFVLYIWNICKYFWLFTLFLFIVLLHNSLFWEKHFLKERFRLEVLKCWVHKRALCKSLWKQTLRRNSKTCLPSTTAFTQIFYHNFHHFHWLKFIDDMIELTQALLQTWKFWVCACADEDVDVNKS